jgi:hypothetical protein
MNAADTSALPSAYDPAEAILFVSALLSHEPRRQLQAAKKALAGR